MTRCFLLVLVLSPMLSWAQTTNAGPRPRPSRVELPRFDIGLSWQWLTQSPSPDPLIDFEETYSAGGLALDGAFHWSERLAIEVEASATARVSVDANYQTPFWNWGSPVFATLSHRRRHARFAVTQLVTFRRRAWVSPQIGAGVVLGHEDDESYIRYVQKSPEYPIEAWVAKLLADHPARTETTARPFVMGAVKFYLTRRAFVRLGATTTLTGAARQSTLRLGIGHDW